jgi:hypothetical protein
MRVLHDFDVCIRAELQGAKGDTGGAGESNGAVADDTRAGE